MTTIVISSGQIVSSATVTSGDREVIRAGGSTVDPQVTDGGVVIVSSGGSVTGATLHLSAITDTAPARMFVSLGGLATDTMVFDGGGVVVSEGETLSTTLSGAYAFPDRPAIHSTERVLSGGLASNTTIEASGEQVIGSSGSGVATIIDSLGRDVVRSGGVAEGTTVNAGGRLVVNGGTANGTLVSGSGSFESLQSGGHASSTVIVDGGVVRLGTHPFRSDITGTTVSSGGHLVITRDSTANDTTVLAGGFETLSMGLGSGLTISRGGRVTYGQFSNMTDITVAGGFIRLGLLSFADGVQVLSGGRMLIVGMSSGTFGESGNAHSLVIADGGTVVVSSGYLDGLQSMSAGGLVLKDGGIAVISSGVTTTGGVVGAGGELIVSSGGSAVGVKVLPGGEVDVMSGADISNLKVGPGAVLTVSSGATATDTKLQHSSEIVAIGGQVSGTTTFVRRSTLALSAPTGISLAVSGFDATDAIELATFQFSPSERINAVRSAGKLQITVTDGTQTASIALFGQYTAAGFHLSHKGAGTTLTYTPPTNAHNELAAGHSQ